MKSGKPNIDGQAVRAHEHTSLEIARAFIFPPFTPAVFGHRRARLKAPKTSGLSWYFGLPCLFARAMALSNFPP
jgi:hypothetical protein